MIKLNLTNKKNGKQIRKEFNYNVLRRSFHLTNFDNQCNQSGLFKFPILEKERRFLYK